MLPSNEQVALWLDPERERAGWWKIELSDVPNLSQEEFRNWLSSEEGMSKLFFTGPDFTQPGPCAEFVEPVLDKHDVWRVRGNHRTSVWYSASDYYNELPPAISDSNHHHACLLALAEVMK